jgi:hypothetical protein
MAMRHLAFVLLAGAASLPARGEIYECIDENGSKRFTNIVTEARGCKPLNVETRAPAPPTPPATPAAKAPAKPPATATPSNFPRVDKQLQRERDHDRRRILEQELWQEEKLLSEARRELSQYTNARDDGTGQSSERIAPLQKKIRLHEDNITSLRREISRLR